MPNASPIWLVDVDVYQRMYVYTRCEPCHDRDNGTYTYLDLMQSMAMPGSRRGMVPITLVLYGNWQQIVWTRPKYAAETKISRLMRVRACVR